MTTLRAAWDRLVRAVLAYDAALQLTGSLEPGEHWAVDSPELDELYAAMLEAARCEPAADTDTRKDS